MQAIAREQGMLLVGQANEPMDVLLLAGESRADVVVLTAGRDGASGVASLLLEQYPELTVLSLAPGRDGAFVEQLCPTRSPVVDTSARNLLAVIRDAVLHPCSGAPLAAPQAHR